MWHKGNKDVDNNRFKLNALGMTLPRNPLAINYGFRVAGRYQINTSCYVVDKEKPENFLPCIQRRKYVRACPRVPCSDIFVRTKNLNAAILVGTKMPIPASLKAFMRLKAWF